MKTEKIAISKIKLNPNNPRLIKDDKFAKLVQSIKDFPEMLEIRPIVVNDDMIILGGNMRFKACKEAGLKEVSIIKVSGLSEEKQREFLIKDNLSGGEWDWTLLHDWNELELEEWGLEVWQKPADVDYSILVYPAWRNVHGVTPIIPTHEGGYRNSLVFYPLKAFKNLD